MGGGRARSLGRPSRRLRSGAIPRLGASSSSETIKTVWQESYYSCRSCHVPLRLNTNTMRPRFNEESSHGESRVAGPPRSQTWTGAGTGELPEERPAAGQSGDVHAGVVRPEARSLHLRHLRCLCRRIRPQVTPDGTNRRGLDGESRRVVVGTTSYRTSRHSGGEARQLSQ